MSKEICIKRVYEPSAPGDGYRILIDRLWPRGLSKEKADVDLWLKEIAPSTELRKWFDHDPKKWASFKKKYHTELKQNKEASEQLREAIEEHKKVTLVYAAKDEEHNDAVVLAEAFS